MKILYGVQGTGNGHITRARAMQVALAEAGIEVDWVFSGRDKDKFFDMQAFGDYKVFKGLSFATRAGKIDLIKTFAEASLVQMYQDIRTLNVEHYDLVVTDFEPVVAWAARKKNIACIGIGHQYAFDQDIPKAENTIASEAIMKWFAPVDLGVGVHWHHFGAPVLPPIIERDSHACTGTNRTLVYLPFEKSQQVLSVLMQFEHPFIYHCGDIAPGEYGNVLVRGFSRDGFKDSLHSTDGVICNAGFELASEALSLGRKIMVKPLKGQMEQASNALALSQLGLGLSTTKINPQAIERFLASARHSQVNYSDVPALLAQWLLKYPQQSVESLVQQAWQGVVFPHDDIDYAPLVSVS
ncbi:MJ1255/VC2487 family glycosyltransferase [Reinekea thalattae]|uniref:Glycosyltransferase n=1 Tax=Reinekea thalattae TaxID=2593301 RepID=A0A5C8Z946_9GAMM|nr:MJ1255/VC2487 family glycosyltransferase [Reinekea thalattae]TXR53763.1 glycosyltransferase [Reinekea thalattae]